MAAGATTPASPYSVQKEVACLAALLTASFHMISLVSTGWAYPVHRESDPSFEGLGLWQYCTLQEGDTFTCYQAKDLSLPPWFHATQAFFLIAFLNMTFDLFLIGTITCARGWRRNMKLVLTFTATSSCSCVFSTIALVVFGSLVGSSPPDLPGEGSDLQLRVSWSYYLGWVATAAHLWCPALGAKEYKKLTANPPLLYSPPIPMVSLQVDKQSEPGSPPILPRPQPPPRRANGTARTTF